jgi:hypothetical protein
VCFTESGPFYPQQSDVVYLLAVEDILKVWIGTAKGRKAVHHGYTQQVELSRGSSAWSLNLMSPYIYSPSISLETNWGMIQMASE